MDRINKDYIDKYLNRLINYTKSPVIAQIENNARLEGLPVLREDTACFLDIMVRSSCVSSILEIGTSIGYSSIVFANAMGIDGRITTIEMDDNMVQKAKDNFKKAGIIDKITIFRGDAGEILHFMEGTYDMIFMDGPKGQYINYFDDCMRLLRTGGLLVCDDVLFYGMVADNKLVRKRKITIVRRMREFLEMITRHPELNTSVIPIGDGISISYKKEAINE